MCYFNLLQGMVYASNMSTSSILDQFFNHFISILECCLDSTTLHLLTPTADVYKIVVMSLFVSKIILEI